MPEELPTGTVTMLFTDIEGSTNLLTLLGPARYGEVLSTQRQIIRSAVNAAGGFEMGTEGDSFFVVFASARDAVAAALTAQRELALSRRSDPPARVRMGLHTGEPTQYENGYVGLDVHRAARIAAAAHGGQLVISETTRRLVADALPEGALVRDLGWHRFKDITDPEHVYQLTAPGLEERLLPLKSLGTRANLPAPLSALIGREAELGRLVPLVGDPNVRLVTLTGPGGIGKSRLALAVAADVGHAFPAGVFFVRLAAVSSADQMWSKTADTLGVPPSSSPADGVGDHLAGGRALLVLDNLEQIGQAGEVVATLLSRASRVTVLATSRRPLHLQGEMEFPVPTLSLPDLAGDRRALRTYDPSQAAESEAVALFVQQASAARPGFALTPDDVEDVVAICRRLDGLPLAILLAAARTRLLSPRALLSRLDDILGLGSHQADLPERQQTLRSTVAWSYDLLAPAPRSVLARLGAFVSGCSLEAAAAVALPGYGDADPAADLDPLDVLFELVDANLVIVGEGPDGEPRFRMLQIVREYALDRLESAPEASAVRDAHAAYFAALVEEQSSLLRGPGQLHAIDRLDQERDNIRAALEWTLGERRAPAGERTRVGMRIAGAMSWFWYRRGSYVDGRRWLDRVVALSSTAGEGPDLLDAMHSLAVLLVESGEAEAARSILERCLAAWRRDGDPAKIAREASSLGVAHRYLGEFDRARDLLVESVALARQAGDQRRLSTALGNLGVVELDRGMPELAIGLIQEGRAIDARLGDAWAVAVQDLNLGNALLLADRLEQATALLGLLAEQVQDLADPDLTATLMETVASLLARLGHDSAAARAMGAADRLRENTDAPRQACDQAILDRFLAPARERAGAAAWQRALAAGRAASTPDALGAAIAQTRRPEP